MTAPLEEAVQRFVEDMSAVLRELGSPAAHDDAVAEALNLACAFVDADRLHTDDEITSLVAAFGPHLNTQLGRAAPADVREAGILDGARSRLADVPAMYGLLRDADRARGTEHARTYFRDALEIGFAVAATDRHTSESELDAITAFQRLLLDAAVPATSPAPAPAAAAPAEDGAPARPLDELLGELDALVGLEGVKREVHLAVNLARIEQLRRSRNLPVLDRSRHLVFTGNPGTGKTTVARLLAELYHALGVVRSGRLVETDRSQLVAGYVGQTAIAVRRTFDEADGGMLLIDEAYALLRGGENDFGHEAIDTIVKLVEDRRESIVVIVAGYPEEMTAFVDANPGLRSRFPTTIQFDDYSDDELVTIFEGFGTEDRYVLDDAGRSAVRAWFAAQPRTKGFGNARLARNLFEATVARQATRLVGVASPTDDQLCTLAAEDVPPPGEVS